MTTTEPDNLLPDTITGDLLRRIMAQRERRYTDAGPDMGTAGAARFRHEGSRLFVAYARVEPADAAISLIVSYARKTSARVIWNVSDASAHAHTLAAALRAHGFTLDERLTLMARQGNLQAPVRANIHVWPITTWADMWAYERGNRQAFYDDPAPETSLVTARASERWRQQQMGWYQYYAVSLGGVFAGGAYVSLWEDVPTLMGVYTLDLARNQGAATAVLARMVAGILATGKTAYCLFVKQGNPARRLYESLGFTTLSDEETYILDL